MRRTEITLSFRCDARWEELEGEGARRWCSRCELDVTDLSAMSEREARALLADGGARCVRFAAKPDGRLVHRPQLGLAALLGLLLGGPAQAQSRPFVFGETEEVFMGGVVQKPQLDFAPPRVSVTLPPELLAALDVVTAEPPALWRLHARWRRLRARRLLTRSATRDEP
ncbi:MAG: hypothetical protein H6741_24170 [Alphaproteobacteria bacterium]|nr:hypothetical protein [Alphaproteobacteria bacterium]